MCDHAGRATPARLGDLGLAQAAFEEHIAWDIGALALSRLLAGTLGACLIHQAYSRLVIDCNRAPDHPASIVTTSDGWRIPANEGLGWAQADARRRAIFDPYHDRIAAELAARDARARSTLLVCVHSFTPVMGGVARPWHVGVLHLGQSAASNAMLAALREEGDLVVGDNEPYAMDGTDYTAPFHGHGPGRDAVELEIRQDLLADGAGVARMAARIGPLLARVAGVQR